MNELNGFHLKENNTNHYQIYSNHNENIPYKNQIECSNSKNPSPNPSPLVNNNSEFEFYIKLGIPQEVLNSKSEKITGLFKRHYFRVSLIKSIISEKLTASIVKIQSAYRAYETKKLIKMNLLLNYILQKREQYAKVIQKKFRTYFYIKEFNKILEKERNHYSVYFIMNSSNRKVQLQIILSNDKMELYNFEFCKARKIYVAYIPKINFKPLTYLCSFVVDGIPVLDSRFPTVYSGQSFYNKIDFNKLNKISESDDEEDDDGEDNDDTRVQFQDQSKFFNLKNIEFFRKKIEEDIKEEITSKSTGFFARNSKKSNSNLSLNNLRKTQIKKDKKLLYVKSLSELLKKAPLKSILKNPLYRDIEKERINEEKCQLRLSIKPKKKVTILAQNVEIYDDKIPQK